MSSTENELAQAGGGFAPVRREPTSMDIATTRSAQEVQAAMVIAKRFPRDQSAAYARIMDACKRPMLAEAAVYQYPRGGQTVEGPSIRLAEAIAQNWGNFDNGFIELSQKNGESEVMAYAWDLETNSRSTKVFTVKHERHKKGGVVDRLTDPRDIYELVANQASRRVRACILAVIPGDITEAAVEQCGKTLAGQTTEPIGDRVRKMVAAFSDQGVTKAMLEAFLGHNLDVATEPELVRLRKIFTSLKDGMSKREQWFDPKATGAPGSTPAAGAAPANLDEMADALAEKATKPKRGAKAEQSSFLTGEPTDAEKAEIAAEERRAAGGN